MISEMKSLFDGLTIRLDAAERRHIEVEDRMKK